MRGGEAKRIRIEEIQRIVARHYNVSKQDLLSNRRTRTIVKPRQIAMYLAKMLTPRSLPEIGRPPEAPDQRSGPVRLLRHLSTESLRYGALQPAAGLLFRVIFCQFA
eukprot:gene27342-32968_t